MVVFPEAFHALTGHPPFPWQTRLYEDYFIRGEIPPACCLPTGLGKTSVIAIWLLALANGAKLSRRLIYVVNRRTVVDQTTEEVEKYRTAIDTKPELLPIKSELGEALRISTLRGQFADNGDWCEDPSRPAVICGTVDMIGSRLLFSGYGIGMKSRPLHAGFLGQDALLIHDEAHLEPAFQQLIEAIRNEQERCQELRPLRVMELTATSKSVVKFTLDEKDYTDATVNKRMNSVKRLHLHELADAKKPQKELTDRALSFRESGKAVLIFATSVESVLDVAAALEKAKLPVRTLTGTMRGKERDDLVKHPTFARFLPAPPPDVTPTSVTVYLVCTSAGEVGINISADHLICDLSTFESMAQRFGRVNRFGQFDECEVHVFYPTTWDEKDPRTIPRQRTLELLRTLGDSVSPKALGDLPVAARNAAFAPEPTILPATDMLFDAWALTTIREKLPGRPPVEPYLHGVSEGELPETQVAWREEVERLDPKYESDADRKQNQQADRKELAKLVPALLEDFPLKPQEVLQDQMFRVRSTINALAEKFPDSPTWVVSVSGDVTVTSLRELAETEKRDGKSTYKIDSRYGTILLPPNVGGLNERGMFDEKSPTANDVSCEWYEDTKQTKPRRARSDEPEPPKEMHLVRSVELPGTGSEESEPEYWYWFALRNTGEPTAKKPVEWSVHVGDVERELRQILSRLSLDESLQKSLRIAAKFHDHGKRRAIFQQMLGNRNFPAELWAKSGKKRGNRLQETYRHEFGSLQDVSQEAEWAALSEEERELVLHLIAAHHGRARPHFPADEAFDPSSTLAKDAALARTVPQRFARLQRKYGRWGLAYLESLLRAADWSASASPSKFLGD